MSTPSREINAALVICTALLMLGTSLHAAVEEGLVEFGNTICPVNGEKIIEDEVVKYEYNGVVYNLCCKMCLKDFKKDPEKYIRKLEEQKKTEEETHGHTHEHHEHRH